MYAILLSSRHYGTQRMCDSDLILSLKVKISSAIKNYIVSDEYKVVMPNQKLSIVVDSITSFEYLLLTSFYYHLISNMWKQNVKFSRGVLNFNSSSIKSNIYKQNLRKISNLITVTNQSKIEKSHFLTNVNLFLFTLVFQSNLLLLRFH